MAEPTIRRVLDAFKQVEIHLAGGQVLDHVRRIPDGLWGALLDFQTALAVIERDAEVYPAVAPRVERLGQADLRDPRKLLAGMPIRCECGGPVAILSNPPGGVSYGVCLACQHAVTVTDQPTNADASD